MIGPLQLVVIGFEQDKYARDIILELKNLRKERTIRIFDLLYIFKHEDGSITSKEVSDLQEEEQREFGTLVRTLLDLSTKDVEHMNADEVAESLGSAEAASCPALPDRNASTTSAIVWKRFSASLAIILR